MANLIETNIWPEGIMQIESGDPVLGGASGISNIPHRELANRTGYLKATHEAHVGDAADPHEYAKYAKQAVLQAHLTEASDPHAAAGYSKATALAEHIADINDPHEAALYLKEATFIVHVDDMNDPHAAAGYAKEQELNEITNDFSAHLASTTPHPPADFATKTDLNTALNTAINTHSAITTVHNIPGQILDGTTKAITDHVNEKPHSAGTVYTGQAPIAVNGTVISFTGTTGTGPIPAATASTLGGVKMVAGTVGATGGSGTGWSATDGSGVITVTFSPGFTGTPTVVATSMGRSYVCGVMSVSSGSCVVQTLYVGETNGNVTGHTDPFNFIAIGV